MAGLSGAMKLEKIGRAKAHDGTKLDIIDILTNEVRKEAVKRLGDGQFWQYNEEGWSHGFNGDTEIYIHALTPEDRKAFNNWTEPKKREIDISSIEHQLVRLKPETRAKLIANVENPDVCMHCEAIWEDLPLNLLIWCTSEEGYDYWAEISHAIDCNLDHPALIKPFKWIKDRPPTEEDADEIGEVSHYYPSSIDKSSEDDWDSWAFKTGMPWAPTSEVQQFTKENPAPSPFDQKD